MVICFCVAAGFSPRKTSDEPKETGGLKPASTQKRGHLTRVIAADEFSSFGELSPQIALDTLLFSITYDGSAIAQYGARDAAYSKHD